ncbi:hypothetical protein LTR62_001515 [Meristemomyces frigidus]|uniref:Membrane anchor Opy2 N-terminal domain-containing protein n=1 Tax=Meristemomyces frigidus TaxID=1508187 RepID=A0AAN7TN46_9PEZI|nr:hypothetical protein LTR62_001515 [Meristemomyces frigidus]
MAFTEQDAIALGALNTTYHTTSPPNDLASEVERTFRTIFRRCLQCPETTPSCPTCKDGKICSLVPTECNACAYATCISNPSPAPSSSGPNIGAIAGGVVGGIIGVAVVVFFVWRFWIKKRREQQELEMEADWEDAVEDDIAQQKRMHSFSHSGANDGVSTRTRGSLANSILSRASNIIQIAYIPGVTNRNGAPNSQAPVPPVPAAHRRGQQPSPKSPLSNEGDMLFFRPGDLRGSTYSDASSLRSENARNRDTTYTQHSITPSLARMSVGSEGYRDSTADIPPMPATTVARAAPKMVSIRSTSATSPNESSPSSSTEHKDFASGNQIQIMMPGEGSGGSTPSSLRGKAKQVTVGGGSNKGRFPVRQVGDASTATTERHMPAISSPLAEMDESDTEETTTPASLDLLTASTPPAVQPIESPFFDASERPPLAAAGGGPNPYSSMGANIDRRAAGGRVGRAAPLSDIIEERRSRATMRGSLGPFGDDKIIE